MRKILRNVNWVFQNIDRLALVVLIFLVAIAIVTILYIFPFIDEAPAVKEDPSLGLFAKILMLFLVISFVCSGIYLELHRLKLLKRKEKSKKEVNNEN